MEEINYINFLKEYNDLCKKYKMGLAGCGCCGSPYLYISQSKKYIDDINYKEDTNEVIIGDSKSGNTIEQYIENIKTEQNN